MCYNLGCVYIDNDNIEHVHLYRDGVHLTHEGSVILSQNYLHSLNNIYWKANHASLGPTKSDCSFSSASIFSDHDNVGNYDYVSSTLDMSSSEKEKLTNVCINEYIDPLVILKYNKISNVNRLVIGHLNIIYLRNKRGSLKLLIKGNIVILVITETKLDSSFPSLQFAIEGYSLPFRVDKNIYSGGVLIYIREDIPCRELTNHITNNIDGIV